MIKAATPYLNFDGNTEEAFTFYRSVFGGEFLGIVRYRDFPGNPMGAPDDELDRIANIALPLGPNSVLMGTDVLRSMPTRLNVGNNFYITLEVDGQEDAVRLFDALSDGGRAEMPLQPTEWAEMYGICADRFGVQWMVMYTGSVQFATAPAS